MPQKNNSNIEPLCLDQIKQQLDNSTKSVCDELLILKHINSTNDYLLDRVKTEPRKIIACFAEQQTQGRGRQGRPWISPYGTNIYYSQLWHFQKKPNDILGLSPAIALAVVQTLKKYGITQKNIGVKWPNDVWSGNQKIAGVLVEIITEPGDYCHVVIGIGLNIRLDAEQATNIQQPWTSLEEITQTIIQRNRLAGLLLNELIITLQNFQENGLQPFLNIWQELDLFHGKPVVLHTANHKINGIMQGISPRGELILLDEHDKIQRFYLSGEMSLRPAF